MTATNAAVEVKVVTLGELFKYFVLWLLMATLIMSCNRRSWFDHYPWPSV